MFRRIQEWFQRSPVPRRTTRAAQEFHLDIEPLEERLAPQLSTTDLTQTNLSNVISTLAGPGVQIFNVTTQSVPSSIAIFNDSTGGGILGCASGVVLSSGDANFIIGPNITDSATAINGLPGDASLQTLIPAGQQTFDATTLEFDFIPQGNVIKFQFVFGSEEYNEFVNAPFNDVFGFFLNGQNLALIPGSSTTISINNVNGGNPFGTGASNPQFFRNNDPNDPGPPSINTELDGVTVLFTIVAPVIPNQTNTLKLAIADVGDSLLDSDVMICANSLTAIKVSTYCPFRYLCDGNGNFTGELTVVNNSKFDLPGPLFVILNSLPPGVTLVNSAGTTPSGNPFLSIPGNVLPAESALKVPIVLHNPNGVALDTELNCQFQISGILL